MSEINHAVIRHAIEKLHEHDEGPCADGLTKILGQLAAPPKSCWVTDENIDGIVRALYPPNPAWPEEMKERHFRLLKCALEVSPEALNHDVREVLKRAEQSKTMSHQGWRAVPPIMTEAMVNAWSGGRGNAVSSNEVAYRTNFQEAWQRLLEAAPESPEK